MLRLSGVLTSSYCAGLFDAVKEIERFQKQLEKFESEVSSAEAKLSNTSFTSKAPEKVVNSFRDQRDQGRQKMVAVKEKIKQMQRYL